MAATRNLHLISRSGLVGCARLCLVVLFLLGAMLAIAPAWGQAAAPGGTAPAAPAAPAPASSSYTALAELLEDPRSREQLVEQLRSLAAAEGNPEQAANGPAPAPARPAAAAHDFSEGVAGTLQDFAAGMAADFSTTAAALRAMITGESTPGLDMRPWLEALLRLLMVWAATMVAYGVLRLGAARIYRRLDQTAGLDNQQRNGSAESAPHGVRAMARIGPFVFYKAVAAIFGALLIDVAVLLLAAGAGYAVAALAAAGDFRASWTQSLFLNAFIAVEIMRAAARLIFATRYPHLRLIRMDTEVAIYWNRWLARLIGMTGYGLLFAVPLVGAIFPPAIGKLVGLVIMLLVYFYALRVIWSNRARLRERLLRRAGHASTTIFGTLIRILARIWHVLGIAYFTVLLIVSQIAPHEALPFMAKATVQTLAAIGVGLLLSGVLTTSLSRRIRLSPEVSRRLPMLESRINSYVPAVLKSLRMLILILVALVVLDAWRALDLVDWIRSAPGQAFIALLVRVAIILLSAMLVWTVVASLIEHRLSIAPGDGAPSEREKTLLALFRNAALVVIVTMTILVVLSQIGIDVGPLIAGAGVVGLAIGFGAQKLVQDVITGVFIQLENGMNQNDVVELCGLFGTVEKITIRSVVIRTLDGGYHLIPFSSVDRLTNHMRGFGYHYGEYRLPHRENPDEVMAQLRVAFDDLMKDPELAPLVLEDISLPGVTSLNEQGFTVRVLIKTVPGMQWAIQRGFNRLVKARFDEAGIELPYPHTVVHFGQDKSGHAAPLRLETESATMN